jgi:hypothetical protein
VWFASYWLAARAVPASGRFCTSPHSVRRPALIMADARNEDFADSAEHAGMSYEELLQKIVTLGLSYEPRP